MKDKKQYNGEMKKIIIACILALALGACSSDTGSSPKERADMSGYSTLTDTDHVFIESSVKEMAEMMDNHESFAVYFGFDECPWCLEAVPLLNEAAKENNEDVYYINTRKNSEWKSNLDIDDYDLLVEKLGDYLSFDDDGVKHLYTPHVFFMKDGSVVYDHEGTIEGHDAHDETLSDEEKETVKGYYEEGFAKMKGEKS